MRRRPVSATIKTVVLALASAGMVTSHAAITDLSDEPLATGLTLPSPNIMFILDDSGSMARLGTPDHVDDAYCRNTFSDSRTGNTDGTSTGGSDGKDDSSALANCGFGDPLFNSPDFNFQTYNPAIYYESPYYPTDDPIAGTAKYPPQNRANTTNWTLVRSDPYNNNNTFNLRDQYFDIVACNKSNPTQAEKFDTSVCRVPVESGVYKYPNPSYNSNVQTGLFPFRLTRTGSAAFPLGPYFYKIDQVLWCKNQNGIATNGSVIAAQRPADGRAAGKFRFGKGAVGNATNPCVTRKGTFAGIVYQFPKFGTVAHNTSNDTAAQNSQTGPTDNEGITGFTRHNIVETVPGNNTLPATYPAKGVRRIDCPAAQCTYDQEMTNFANWYAYYKTRIEAMKTAAGLAFKPKAGELRVGFITINPGSPVDRTNKYLAIDYFTRDGADQKKKWYDLFYAQDPGPGTPLREALSRVGRHFAGKTDGINQNMTEDPIIASCQQNFAILTTDGYWNGNGGQKLDRSTMDDQDGNIATSPRPYYDGTGTQSNTLADVAMYYYTNDLRPAGSRNAANVDVSKNNVPVNGADTASHQHMTVFTLGLGIDGRLAYDPNYETQIAGDFASIKSGLLDWPAPAADQDTAVDDLWHAAVNGRGKYFSARDPQLLSDGLREALNVVNARIGSGAAAATSSLRPVTGDNFVFTAEYQTVKWDGDLKARTIDVDPNSPTFGVVSSAVLWSAQKLLDDKVWSTRRIKMFDAAAVTKLKDFCFSCMTAAEQANFMEPAPVGGIKRLNQILQPDFTATQLANATPERLVDYLRGDSTYYDTGGATHGVAPTDLFRFRTHKLGDITNSRPIYIKKPPFDYTDPGYETFKANQASRKGVVLVGANDGMLHAFETDPDGSPYFQTGGFATAGTGDDTYTGTNDGGNEVWAYVPSMLLPNLYKLAENRPFNHRFLVDGSPVVADVCANAAGCTANEWKTIMVAGLNKGGRGYYALDVTDPLNPRGLWEIQSSATCLTDAQARAGTETTDCHIGYSFGQAIVTKLYASAQANLNAGRWVVLLTSGYNNVSPGDGRGYLYVVDAVTGKIIDRVTTGEGDALNPSGFAKINAFIDRNLKATAVTQNVAQIVYGGDLFGNLWRINISTSLGTFAANKLAQLTSLESPPKAQPITTRPEIAVVPRSIDSNAGVRTVFVGTGQFLGASDVATTAIQTIYGIKDGPDKNDYGFSGLVNLGTLQRNTMGAEASLPDGSIVRSVSGTAIDFLDAGTTGFRIDLPAGERMNVDPELQVGTFTIPSNTPEEDSCSAGGFGWLNNIDYRTGLSVNVTGTGAGSFKRTSGMIVGISVVQLPGGATVAIEQGSDNQTATRSTTGASAGGTPMAGKRTAWRELIVE